MFPEGVRAYMRADDPRHIFARLAERVLGCSIVRVRCMLWRQSCASSPVDQYPHSEISGTRYAAAGGA